MGLDIWFLDDVKNVLRAVVVSGDIGRMNRDERHGFMKAIAATAAGFGIAVQLPDAQVETVVIGGYEQVPLPSQSLRVGA